MANSQKSIADADALIIYRVGPVYCCSPTLTVESVIMPPSLTHTPGVNEAQPGVFKYSSGVVRVVNLRKRFGVEKEQWQKPGRIIIAEVMGGHAGFWVDEIVDVVQMPMIGWNSLPAQLPRDVFSKTLLMNDVIHLYAEFERLDAFKETGYLRQHIEMLLEQAVKKQMASTTQDKEDEDDNGYNSDNTNRTSVESTTTDPRLEVQADKLESEEINKLPLSAQASVTPPAISDTHSAFKTNTGSADRPRSTQPLVTKRQLPPSSLGAHLDRVTTAAKASDSELRSAAGAHATKDNRTASGIRPPLPVSQTVQRDEMTMPGKRKHSQMSRPDIDRQNLASVNGVIERRDRPSSRLPVAPSVISVQTGQSQSVPETESSRGGVYLLVTLLLLMPVAWYGVTEWQQMTLSDTTDETVKIPIKRQEPAQYESVEAVELALPIPSEVKEQVLEESVPEPQDKIMLMSESDDPVVDGIEYRADIERDEEGIVIVLSQSAMIAAEPDAITATDDIDDASVKVEAELETKTEIDNETVAVKTYEQEHQHVMAVEQVNETEVGATATDDLPVKELSLPLTDSGVDAVVKATGSVANVSASTQVYVHVVIKGDTLWHIAKRYVKNPYLYPELARLSKIKNPDLIYPGDRVKIILKN